MKTDNISFKTIGRDCKLIKINDGEYDEKVRIVIPNNYSINTESINNAEINYDDVQFGDLLIIDGNCYKITDSINIKNEYSKIKASKLYRKL